jgi:hypothetical protein
MPGFFFAKFRNNLLNGFFRAAAQQSNQPVESGFVKKPQDWLYSFAGNYYGLDQM